MNSRMSRETSPIQEPDPDAELMLRVAAGDERAFVDLVHRHQSHLLNFFSRMGVYNDAEDLVQETFVRLYKVRHKYELRARFTTFLYVLARHVWADRGRQAARRDRLCACLKTDADIAVDVPPARRPAGLDVEEALGKLSPKLREALVLNIYQGLRYQEIADVLGLPLGTVKSRIHLALQALRESFNEQES